MYNVLQYSRATSIGVTIPRIDWTGVCHRSMTSEHTEIGRARMSREQGALVK